MEKTSHKPRQSDKDAKARDKKSPTYQEALDEAVEQSFPASDPIAPGAAEKADREISTPKDDKDWERKQGPEEKKVAGTWPEPARKSKKD